MKLTKSQVTTAVSGLVAFISGVTTAVTPFIPFIPERHKPAVMLALGLLAAAGAGLASVNQSLSGEHKSLPAVEVKAIAEAGLASTDPLVNAALRRIREMSKS